MDEERLNESLNKAGNWLRDIIESVNDVRKLSVALIALTDSGDDRFGHHIQRMATKIKSSQDDDKGLREGSWNGELWDTAHALIALSQSSINPIMIREEVPIKMGLKYIDVQWGETNLDNWWDYIPETIACCKAIIEVEDKEQFEHVETGIRWLIGRKCEDGSFASTKYTAQIISLLSDARDELNIDENDEIIKSGVEFLKEKINDPDVKMFNDPWLTSQIISALIDAGVDRNDPEIEKCCNALLNKQEESESGNSWLESITRTANCMMAISKVLGPLKIQKRKEDYWTRVNPRPGRLLWQWRPNNESETTVGHGTAKIDVIEDDEPTDIKTIPKDQFNISLVEDINKKLEDVSLISTSTRRKKRGAKQETVQKTVQDTESPEEKNYLHEMESAGKLLYNSILTILDEKETFEGILAKNRIGHLKIQTEGDKRLNSIPWELIHDKDNFSCLKYALGRSIKNKKRTDEEENEKFKILLVGDPTETLQGVNSELDALKKGLEIDGDDIIIKKIYGKDVTREKFFTEISEGNYDIIHFAGHADLVDGSSYLIFKDAETEDKKTRVGAEDLAIQIENCSVKPKIIFMNACSSAAKASNLDSDQLDYDDKSANIALDFVTELQRVNISAYIGAIWPIHDVQAAEFAIRFYKNLRKGCTLGDAVRLSRIDAFIEDPDELTWASYVLYGKPTTRIKLRKEITSDTVKNVNIPTEFQTGPELVSKLILEKSEKAIELLSDPRYEFRKKKTLTNISKMSDEEFEEFLKLYPQVKRSPISAVDGSELYRLDKSMFKF